MPGFRLSYPVSLKTADPVESDLFPITLIAQLEIVECNLFVGDFVVKQSDDLFLPGSEPLALGRYQDIAGSSLG